MREGVVRRIRWADDSGSKLVEVEGSGDAAPPCPWDSRRWPCGGALSLAQRLFAEGRWEPAPFRVPGSVGKKDWILSNVRAFEFPQHTVFR